MSKVPFGEACCPPQAEGITYLTIGPDHHRIGMMGLELVFQQLLALQRRPEEVSDGEIIGMARRSNYIPPRPDTEAHYAVALREVYARFYKQALAREQASAQKR